MIPEAFATTLSKITNKYAKGKLMVSCYSEIVCQYCNNNEGPQNLRPPKSQP